MKGQVLPFLQPAGRLKKAQGLEDPCSPLNKTYFFPFFSVMFIDQVRANQRSANYEVELFSFAFSLDTMHTEHHWVSPE